MRRFTSRYGISGPVQIIIMEGETAAEHPASAVDVAAAEGAGIGTSRGNAASMLAKTAAGSVWVRASWSLSPGERTAEAGLWGQVTGRVQAEGGETAVHFDIGEELEASVCEEMGEVWNAGSRSSNERPGLNQGLACGMCAK